VNVAYLACGGWIASAVGAAAELGLADLLAAGPQSAEALAAATGTSPRVLARVLVVLASMEVFERREDGTFANTSASELLRATHPASLRQFCRLASGMYQAAFGDLMHALRTGEPASRKTFGGSIYSHMARDADAAEVYDLAMEELARPVGPAIVAARAFTDVALAVDIGGGRGSVLAALLAASPRMRGICVDREAVCARAAAALARSDPALAARLTFTAGDFFSALPAGGDLYLLKNVLHNWGDERAVAILERVREAMHGRAGARLLVVEALEGTAMPGRYMGLDQLLQVVVCEPGAEGRTPAALAALLDRSGFVVTSAVPLATGHTLTEARVASPG
jgi:hypothetical protein